jgi:hypothetical protein
MKQLYVIPCVVCLCVAAAAAPASAATLRVNSGGSLQTALNAAQPGDTILLQAGATFTGSFTLPAKSGASYITVRSSASDAQLPPAGVRITTAYASLLPKIKAAANSSAIKTAAGAHHWKFQFIEIIGNATGNTDIVRVGSGLDTSAASLPHHVVFDRVWIHGHATAGAKRGIALNGGQTVIQHSRVTDIFLFGIETQALAGWNGTGPFLIDNNYLSAAGVNVMFGGATPKIPNLVPSDITIRRNWFTKNLQWRGAVGTKPMVKNLLELKNARRVLVEGNRFEYSWAQDQKGYAILLTPVNNGAAPWTAVQDVTVRSNRFDHVGGGVNITGRDRVRGSQISRRIRIANNLFTDVSRARWGGSGAFIVCGDGTEDVAVDHNTVIHDGPVANGHGPANVRFVYTNNLSKHNQDGIYGDYLGAGLVSITKYFPGATIRRNVLAGGAASKYPADNFFPPTSQFLGNFVNAGGGNYRLAVHSPYNNAGTDGRDIGANIDAIEAASR